MLQSVDYLFIFALKRPQWMQPKSLRGVREDAIYLDKKQHPALHIPTSKIK